MVHVTSPECQYYKLGKDILYQRRWEQFHKGLKCLWWFFSRWQGHCFWFNLCTNTSTDWFPDTSSIIRYKWFVDVALWCCKWFFKSHGTQTNILYENWWSIPWVVLYIVPGICNLLGYPEALRHWSKCIHAILEKLDSDLQHMHHVYTMVLFQW